MENTNNDKRIKKTRAAILDALLSLLKEKNINDITITEIAERAGINRKTFYAHYSSVEEVIDFAENESAHDLKNLLSTFQPEDGAFSPRFLFQCLNTLIKGTTSYYDALLSLDKNPLLVLKYSKVLEDIIYDALRSSHEAQNINPDILSIVSAYIAGGIFGAYVKWAKEHPNLSQEEVANLTSSLLVIGLNGFGEHTF